MRDVLRHTSRLPTYITLVLSERDVLEAGAKSVERFVRWCGELGITTLSVYIDVLEVGELEEAIVERVVSEVRRTFERSPYSVVVIKKLADDAVREDVSIPSSPAPPEVVMSVGFGGKSELVHAVRALLREVKEGRLRPEDIDEDELASHLLFPNEPDLVIRSGGRRLADFLVWQSVYSEIYFTDVNWKNFRKVDFLRAVRDFQRRQRRFGR
ncbi:MAG TPA: UDP diphosphate synthase [Methermicoccus shengliensis]|uniref:UDP diphosphate synthase n=2 Tax=Methermicoccus shengliensis TaxID=660064 RepID=A0A832VWT3_9EURY|nr:UDP diphosphate synthase [Methermicoccus shengliensis]